MGHRAAVAAIGAACAAGAAAAGCPLTPFAEPPDPGCNAPGIRCDDGKDCTLDTCDADTGACVFEPLAQGAPCAGDGDACNGVEACDGAGKCAPGTPPAIDDGDACTLDACDPATGEVTHTPIPDCPPAPIKGWRALSATGAPQARALHTAVWTGARMIVWGGQIGVGAVTLTGGLYDPATDTWQPTSTSGAPSARHSHTAVWTGSRMIVWGGFGESDYAEDGGSYDPATDTWKTISADGAPNGRTDHRVVWTGDEMVLWGGLRVVAPLGDGGRYRPADDAWAPVAKTAAPSARLAHAMAWTGRHVVVFGGTNTFDWLDDGAYYDPAEDKWGPKTPSAGAPSIRESMTGLWIDPYVVVWGGWNGGTFWADGALLDPDIVPNGGWKPMGGNGAPSVRAKHVSAWTGSELFVWGGCNNCFADAVGGLLGDGGLWRPASGYAGGSWRYVAGVATLDARIEHALAWTGSELVVWGGRGSDKKLRGDGARADPATF
jgi:hypothetical protein